MKILVVHNRYQVPGGEDVVVAQELALLRANGFEVETFFVDNDAISSRAEKVRTAAQVVYSWQMRDLITKTLRSFKPDVMHVHNTFPLLSPSIYDAARDLRCPIVQTIHNYRLVCLNGTLFRDGEVCLDCVGKPVAWPGVRHRCYRASAAGSASVALMLAANHLRGAWSDRVDRFLMLTPFARDFFAEHTKIPPERMCVKPNAVADPGVGEGCGGYALFVGRLSAEKGIAVLLEAAKQGLGLPLKIAGQGPMEAEVKAAHAEGHAAYLGPQAPGQVHALMHDAAFLVFPSQWYEGLPMVLAEAFGAGLPIIASDIGSLASLVEHEQTGLLVRPGDVQALRQACKRLAADQSLRSRLRLLARRQYVLHYQPESNLAALSRVYRELLSMPEEKGSNTAAHSFARVPAPAQHSSASHTRVLEEHPSRISRRHLL